MRFSSVPPHASSRVLRVPERNWLMRYELAACTCTPSNPAALAQRAAWAKSSTRRPISCVSSARGMLASTRSRRPSGWRMLT